MALDMLAMKLWIQYLLSDLKKLRKAISSDVRVALENGSCYCCKFSSYNCIGNPRSVWLDIIRTIVVRVVDSCSYYLSSE
eukprot:576408-Pelagomonas_calceolata.AAC.1